MSFAPSNAVQKRRGNWLIENSASGGGGGGITLPLQMTFSAAGLDEYKAMGFVFAPEAAFWITTYYDAETVNAPAGADNDPNWTVPAAPGMPPPSGAHYANISVDVSTPVIITLPPAMRARQIFCWWTCSNAFNNTIQLRYSNNTVVNQSRVNSAGYSLFGAMTNAAPYKYPDPPPIGDAWITHVEFLTTGNARIMLDDLTFYG